MKELARHQHPINKEWWRVVQSDSGACRLESINDSTLNRSGDAPTWAYACKVPSRQYDSDDVAEALVSYLMGKDDEHRRGSAAITADTITDEQIRELLSECRRNSGGHWEQRALECEAALFDMNSIGATERRQLARTRCAEILNARSA